MPLGVTIGAAMGVLAAKKSKKQPKTEVPERKVVKHKGEATVVSLGRYREMPPVLKGADELLIITNVLDDFCSEHLDTTFGTEPFTRGEAVRALLVLDDMTRQKANRVIDSLIQRDGLSILP